MNLLDWQTLVFVLPLALCALYGLVLAAGLVGTGGAGAADAHGDVDAGALGDADVGGLDTGADLGGLDTDADFEADAAGLDSHADVLHTEFGADGHDADGAAGGPLAAVFDLLGVGRAPLSVLLMCFALTWGVVGLGLLLWLGSGRAVLAMAGAGVAGVLITGRFARLVGRLIPSIETYAEPPRALLGLHGSVLYSVTPNSGTVRVLDATDVQHDVAARVASRQPAIPAGTGVTLLHYDAARAVFVVAPRSA